MGWQSPSPVAVHGFTWAVLSGGACCCLLPTIKGPEEQLPAAAVSKCICARPPAPHAAPGRWQAGAGPGLCSPDQDKEPAPRYSTSSLDHGIRRGSCQLRNSRFYTER
ncbi:hypothetical protein Y1Q_0014642 [Alligator mississippiensis]|uniref:Uncharacterized protein n=1 Tax=Alligator mississippiensis TaxID=8496 RepID=A0A151P822_ALLMI|nr:hypothetical protein Y1Q_0014642 [Alligator mississippiensis]